MHERIYNCSEGCYLRLPAVMLAGEAHVLMPGIFQGWTNRCAFTFLPSDTNALMYIFLGFPGPILTGFTGGSQGR